MFNLTIKKSAGTYKVTIETRRGVMNVDVGGMNSKQQIAFRELTVDSYCRSIGQGEVYGRGF